jgi:hypothetical protein
MMMLRLSFTPCLAGWLREHDIGEADGRERQSPASEGRKVVGVIVCRFGSLSKSGEFGTF